MFAKILYLERTPQQKFLDRFRKILNQKMKTKPVMVLQSTDRISQHIKSLRS